MRRDVFQAIADPRRREILGLLAKEQLTLNGLAKNFRISRPAISKHVKILAQCGLVELRREGRERYCTARIDRLDEVASWVEEYRKIWQKRLDSLERYLNTIQRKEKQHGRKN